MAKAKKKVTAKKEVVSKIEKVKELFKKIVSWVDSKGFSALLSTEKPTEFIFCYWDDIIFLSDYKINQNKIK